MFHEINLWLVDLGLGIRSDEQVTIREIRISLLEIWNLEIQLKMRQIQILFNSAKT